MTVISIKGRLNRELVNRRLEELKPTSTIKSGRMRRVLQDCSHSNSSEKLPVRNDVKIFKIKLRRKIKTTVWILEEKKLRKLHRKLNKLYFSLETEWQQSPSFSRTLQSILADLKITVVWMVSIPYHHITYTCYSIV